MQCSSDCMLYLVCIIWDEFTRKIEFILWMLSRVDSFFSETTILWSLLRYTTKGHKFLALWPFQGCKAAQWPWGGAGPIFFKDGYRPQEAMLKIFLEFSPLISDICLYWHFCAELNLQFSELNIMPSVRPNWGIF